MRNPRLDQDIHFAICGVLCVMTLDTTAMGVVSGDLFIVKVMPGYQTPESLQVVFMTLDRLTYHQTTRYGYSLRNCDECLWLEVNGDGLLSVSEGIMESLPDWDGDSFDFISSARLARILQDMKTVWPEFVFTRSDGAVIEFERFINGGLLPLSPLDAMFDDVMGADDEASTEKHWS